MIVNFKTPSVAPTTEEEEDALILTPSLQLDSCPVVLGGHFVGGGGGGGGGESGTAQERYTPVMQEAKGAFSGRDELGLCFS